MTHSLPIPRRWLGVLLALACLLPLLAQADINVRLTSQFLARGEQAWLDVVVSEADPSATVTVPRVPHLSIQSDGLDFRPRRGPGRRIEFVRQFSVSSYEIGTHVIPPVELRVRGELFRSEPIEVTIFDPDDLQWSEVEVAGRSFRYASGFWLAKDRIYEGESVPVELKVYVPREISATVEDWGIPEFERQGVAAWRFEPSDARSPVNLLGRPYEALAYPSLMAPTRGGEVEIGPASLRLTTVQLVVDRFSRREFVEVFLQIPKLAFDALPLPPGAPAGFEKAVGDFTISASTSETEIREGEPIMVELSVSGRGSFDGLLPPRLADPEGWRVYDTAAAEQRGEERRRLDGRVLFRQFIRPEAMHAAIPPFRLVYFDPVAEEYRTASTEPIPITMTPGSSSSDLSSPPPALSTPVERMTDILGPLGSAQLLVPASLALPGWTLHGFAGLLATWLALRAAWLRWGHKLRRDPRRDARLAAWRDLAQRKGVDDAEFLRAAGAHIERWHGGELSPELRDLLAERDSVCFRSEKPAIELDRQRRDAILRLLRKCALACWLLAIGLASVHPVAAQAESEIRPEELAAAAMEAYDSSRYDDAIRMWLELGDYRQLSPDVLYNIGNASYRLGAPGYAALFYRRALERDPRHAESLQNLRFLERKHGSISVNRPEYQTLLARVRLERWQGLAWLGGWLILLGLLTFPASRPGASLRVAGIAALIAGPLVASSGALAWHYYPDDARHASLQRQAVIVAEGVVVHADAARTAPEVIDAPVGSLCEIIRVNGDWAYIAFATKTRGWVLKDSIERLIPDGEPGVPRVRKPRADGSTA